MTRALRARTGTTVIELVVALVITGVVAAAGAAAFRQAIDRRTQLLTSSSATERTAARRALLRDWLGTGVLAWPADTNALVFTTTAAPMGVPPGTVLRLYVDTDDATPERGLALAFRRTSDGPVVRREIDGDIDGMTVEYFDAETQRWYAGADAPLARPAAVRLSFAERELANGGDSLVVHDRLRELPLTVVMSASPATDSRLAVETAR